MSSTRHAAPGGPIRPERWASSQAYKVALHGNLVAKRAALLCSEDHRALAWFIQMIALDRGGLEKCVDWIVSRIGKDFGPTVLREIAANVGAAPTRRQIEHLADIAMGAGCSASFDGRAAKAAEAILAPIEDLALLMSKHSAQSPLPNAAEVIMWYRLRAAEMLPTLLIQLCLDPELAWESCAPFYLPDLIEALGSYRALWIKERSATEHVTPIGTRMHAALDYAVKGRGLVMVHGQPGMGKSHAARQWCNLNAGVTRLVRVPPTTSEEAFFSAIARELGVATGGKCKQIRAKVEEVLSTGHVALVLDDAHHLFPDATSYRDAQPRFVQWVLSMSDAAIPSALIVSPQFFSTKGTIQARTGWSSEQLEGRCLHVEWLPERLSVDEIAPVCRRLLPELAQKECRYLAAYAATTLPASLGAAARIAKRVRYLAAMDKRAAATLQDLQEAVTGDSSSRRALEIVEKQSAAAKRKGRFNGHEDPAQDVCNTPLEAHSDPKSDGVTPRFLVEEPMRDRPFESALK